MIDGGVQVAAVQVSFVQGLFIGSSVWEVRVFWAIMIEVSARCECPPSREGSL